MTAGKFITFEGGEGTGKSTHTKLLRERLCSAGHEVVLTREPGGTSGAEAIRDLLVTGDAERWSPLSETLLNFAARDDHLARVIRPALERGVWVICDRFTDSTRAYQGAGGGIAQSFIEAIDAEVVGQTQPELTVIMDLDPSEGLSRADGRSAVEGAAEDRFESKTLAFHQTLREAFLAIADAQPQRCVTIDSSRSQEDVGQEIWDHIVSRLKP